MFSSAAAFLHGRWRLWSICHINRHVFSIILLTFLQILHSKIPSPGNLVKTRHIWRHDLQTESTGSRRSEMIGDSCSRCERVDNSTSSWVDLCRYKRPLRRMKILATRHWLQWQSWMAACPRCLCLHSADEDAVSWLTNYSPHDIVVANIHTYTK